ncbi:SseB family protein [Phytohabitans rumicis]|uniref:SseB protein N-terminal domain-containing protein n=1 Tax=Phytohabitans rumicis TaxID=1076125 RepID=A0A6V8KY40_9ACTN|nr:SseB family protein [Phytohabitans rumicis]GFJ88744.1 hypothetical protein Prum_023860 [Phytohabitans rumicis]
MTTPWTPANDVERRLHDAVRAGDQAQVMRILAVSPLVVPGFASAASSDPQQRLLTRERDGVPYLLVFTSPEAMQRAVESDGWRQTSLQEVVQRTPAGWGLAINPVTPIGVLVNPDDLPTLVPTQATVAGFVPANEVERLLRDALVAPDPDVFLDVLVTARVIVPTRALDLDGAPTVPVFTSPERYEECLGDAGVPTRTMDFVAMLQQWPGTEYRLAVNFGSPIAVMLHGEQIPELLAHAVELARRFDGPTSTVVPVVVPFPDDDIDPPVPLPPGDIGDLLRGQG